MRKLIFIAGFIICSLLFFLSGTLTGYLYCERSFTNEDPDTPKQHREASKQPKNVLIGRIAKNEMRNLGKKIRTPNITSFSKVDKYKNESSD